MYLALLILDFIIRTCYNPSNIICIPLFTNPVVSQKSLKSRYFTPLILYSLNNGIIFLFIFLVKPYG